MTPAQRRALDKIHDKEAGNVSIKILLLAVASRGGYPEDNLARAQAADELEIRGVQL
jgi:hypothetical protein